MNVKQAIREGFEAGFQAAAKEYGAERVEGDMAVAWKFYAMERFPEDES